MRINEPVPYESKFTKNELKKFSRDHGRFIINTAIMILVSLVHAGILVCSHSPALFAAIPHVIDATSNEEYVAATQSMLSALR